MNEPYYTIPGKFTGKDYLVVVNPGIGLSVYPPGQWGRDCPGLSDGLWWHPGGSTAFRSKTHLLLPALCAERYVKRRERVERKKWRLEERARRLAKRRSR